MTDPHEGDPPDPPPLRRDLARDDDRHDSAAVFGAQVRAARAELENQVAHARDQFEEANERIKRRTGRDLLVATAIGLAIGVVVVATLVFFKWVFVLFALAASVLGTWELCRALQAHGRRIDLVSQVGVGTLLVLSALLGGWFHWVMVFVAVAVVIVWRLVGQMIAGDGRIYGDVLRDAVTGGFVQLYVPFFGSLCVLLLKQSQGEWWVLAFVIVVVAVDVGAYATGLSFGRHPMAPRISPKKTWEGFAGAAAAALIAGVLVALFMLHIPVWAGLLLGALLLGTATAGDLGESMLKRDLGIKDMSSWLPGHGGVLDRLDSILPSTAATLALYFVLAPWVAT